MSEPLVFVGTYSIKEGKLEETKKNLQEVTDLVEANEPRLISFNFYLDEEGGKATCVQVHPDAASMQFHMSVIAEHLQNTFEYLDKTESLELYGSAPDELVAGLAEYVEPGALRVMPAHEVGFTRAAVR